MNAEEEKNKVEQISKEEESTAESLELEKDIVEVVPKNEEEEGVELKVVITESGFDLESWKPKTELGRKVKSGEITNIDQILMKGWRILEAEIVEALVPNLESELLMIGQSKGKFGGGARRVFRQTQKKTPEGNKPSFATMAVIGNKDGYVGVGFGKSKDTVPAREKAINNAKLNLFKIKRGSGSWEDASLEKHSIPFAVEGKCGSVRVKLLPAPRGKGLVVEKEISKIMRLVGIKNIWSKSKGQTKTKINMIKATVSALKKLSSTKTQAYEFTKNKGVVV